MKKIPKLSNENRVMHVHSFIFTLTFFVPFLLWVTKVLSVKRCFSLMGVGLFILTGHTVAFFDRYTDYLKNKDTVLFTDEASLKKFLRLGIAIDFSLAFFFYVLGMD